MTKIDHVLARPAVPLVAGAVVLVLGLVALAGAALVARGGTGTGVATVVVPPRADQSGSGTGTVAGAAGSTLGTSDKAVAAAAPGAQGAAGSSVSLPVIGPPCSAAAPTVQFQGRGLAATGMAPIVSSEPDGGTMALNVTVQQTGSDAASVVAGVQGKLSAIEAVLEKAGVPATSIQRAYFNTYGSARQFSAYASIVAQVPAAQLADATRAVLQVDGVTGYSTGSSLAGQPSQRELQAAAAVATSQATDMATAMARTAGVRLGSIDSVVTQPPTVCYGGAVPTRMVQVTLTYSLR